MLTANHVNRSYFCILARRGSSRWCNNFGSYQGYKRRGGRVGSGPAFDPMKKSAGPLIPGVDQCSCFSGPASATTRAG